MQEEVLASFSLLIGSKIIHERDLPDPLPTSIGSAGAIDGALLLQTGETFLLDERYWDRLDESLCELLDGLRQSRNGEEVEVEFPDTRLQITLTPNASGPDTVGIEYREIEADLASIEKAVQKCASRFLEATASLTQTKYQNRLQTLLQKE